MSPASPAGAADDKEQIMMNGYGIGFGMGFGWLGMVLVVVVTGLLVAALVKYLRK